MKINGNFQELIVKEENHRTQIAVNNMAKGTRIWIMESLIHCALPLGSIGTGTGPSPMSAVISAVLKASEQPLKQEA